MTLASLILAATLGAPEVRMPLDFYHLCITEHPTNSAAFLQCALALDKANREKIGPDGFKQLEACRDALDHGQDHRLILEVAGTEIECEGRPPTDTTTPAE